MISDELLTSGLVHAEKRVELASEVAFESLAGGGNSLHDLITLLVGDAGAERIVSEVTADTNTGRVDEGSLLLGEGRGVELGGVHVRDVLVAGLVTMVVLHNLVEELVESAAHTELGVQVI